MKLVVPDASVLLKWVLPEEGEPNVEQAIALRDAFLAGRILLRVPPLWFYEAGNVLVGRYSDSASERLAALASFRIPEARPYPAWREQIIAIATNYRVTFYDATYHALAVVLGGVLVTADDKYHRKVAPAPQVLPLARWSLS